MHRKEQDENIGPGSKSEVTYVILDDILSKFREVRELLLGDVAEGLDDKEKEIVRTMEQAKQLDAQLSSVTKSRDVVQTQLEESESGEIGKTGYKV